MMAMMETWEIKAPVKPGISSVYSLAEQPA
jgi:hypothetical protein